MRRHLCPALLMLLTSAASAADLSQIERKIARQPVYQTQTPRYCLLVFGDKAQQRVWLVEDGNALYIDRNSNGDLTEPGERVTASATGRVFQAGNLDPVRDLPLYSSLWLRRLNGAFEIIVHTGANPREARRLFAGCDPPGQLKFADRPADAPIVHFDGPLELRLMEPPAALTAGQETKLQVVLGTPGLGAGTFAKQSLLELLPARADIAFSAAADKGHAITFTGHEG